MVVAGDVACLYNMACSCGRLAFSLGSAEATSLTDASFPVWVMSAHAVENCLNASIAWLVTAVGAGWHDAAHTQVDPDLAVVRSQRAAAFSAVRQLLQQAQTTGV